jgi:hypothetical protein
MNTVHSKGSLHAVTMICMLCVVAVVPSHAAPPIDDTSIPARYGYILFLIYGLDERSVRRLRMTNLNTGKVTTVISTARRSSGPASWLELLAVPEGRYYWSEVQLGYRNSPVYDLSKPGRSNYVFEVTPGVVNYIGDWFIDGYWAEGRPRVPTTYNLETLKEYIAKFPDHAEAFDVYYSTKDNKPYRFGDLVEITEELAEQ